VSFHSGWELVEWVPKSVDLGENYVETLEICDEFEEEEPEVFRPQIELNLGNPSDMGEPPVEVAGVAPTMEAEDESSVEVLEAKASVEKDAGAEAKGTGAMPVHEMQVGDSYFEDYPGDDFEKVGELTLEETPQTLAPEIPSEETPSSAEPRRKRIKTPAGRTDLPWVWKLIAQRSQTSPLSP